MKCLEPPPPAVACAAPEGVLADLYAVVAALDRRTARPGRTGEDVIVAEASALRREAVRRIGQLEAAVPAR